MTSLSDNALCVLRILEDAGSLSTSEILQKAKRSEYADLCSDCAGGDAFVVAANQLVERGLIKREFGKGGYHWHLVRNQ